MSSIYFTRNYSSRKIDIIIYYNYKKVHIDTIKHLVNNVNLCTKTHACDYIPSF